MPRPPIERRKPGVDPWTTVQSGINDILERRQSSLSLASLHNAVGAMVSASKVDELTSGLSRILEARFKGWSSELSQRADNPLIAHFSAIYSDFQNYCTIIPKFYMLYDRRFDASNAKSQTRLLIRTLFKRWVLSDKKLMDDTTAGIRRDISSARSLSGGDQDLSTINQLLQMYYSFRDDEPRLDIFDTFFGAFQAETQEYYDGFFLAKFEGNSFPAYLEQAAKQFDHEESILKEVLRKEEQEEILIILHRQLLFDREDRFIGGSDPPISSALIATDGKPIKWLVDNYLRFSADLERIYQACAEYVKNQMLKFAPEFTPELKSQDIARVVGVLIKATLDLSSPYGKAFKDVAKASDVLEDAIKSAWNNKVFDIVNNMCVYIDTHIKEEFKTMTKSDRAAFPSIIARFYTSLEDKKRFGELYVVGMMRRLINMRIKLIDLEFPIINAIRRAKAPEFAKAWVDYVKKIKESNDLETEFSRDLGDPKLAKIAFAPLVFEQRTFPLDKLEAKQVPKELEDLNHLFVGRYITSHPMTKLTLLADVSNVEAKLVVPKNAKSGIARTYIVSSDLICTSILLAVFDKVAEGGLTLHQIVDKVGDRGLVGPYLIRLCARDCPLLGRTTKVPGEKKMLDDDIFYFNPQFFFNFTRVVVPPIVSERKKDAVSVTKKVDEERAYGIRAAIVRILKMEKHVEQGQLESKVIHALRNYFQADVAVIREQIQDLEKGKWCERFSEGGQTIVKYEE
jgi:hypothetical protein